MIRMCHIVYNFPLYASMFFIHEEPRSNDIQRKRKTTPDVDH